LPHTAPFPHPLARGAWGGLMSVQGADPLAHDGGREVNAPAADVPVRRTFPTWARFCAELIPTIVFLSIFYTTEDRLAAIVNASFAEAGTAAAVGAAFYAYTRTVPWLMIETTCFSIFSACMTLAFESDLWFKIRGTIVPVVVVAVLLGAERVRGLNLIELALAPYYGNLLRGGWDALLHRFYVYQLIMAALNESLWRTLDFDVWVAVMRTLNITASLLFGLCVFSPIIVHYARARRVVRPPPALLTPSVMRVCIARPDLDDLELDLGMPGEGGDANLMLINITGKGEPGFPPIELRAGDAVRLRLWLRVYGSKPRRVFVRAQGLALLCAPIAAQDGWLTLTGSTRRVPDGADTGTGGFLMPQASRARDVEYAADFAVPTSLLARGLWFTALIAGDAQGNQILTWAQSVRIVGNYSSRAHEVAPPKDETPADVDSLESAPGAAAEAVSIRPEPLQARSAVAAHDLPFTAGSRPADLDAGASPGSGVERDVPPPTGASGTGAMDQASAGPWHGEEGAASSDITVGGESPTPLVAAATADTPLPAAWAHESDNVADRAEGSSSGEAQVPSADTYV